MRILLTAVLAIAAWGCGSGDQPTTASSKNLFSSWAEDNSTFVLDMSRGSFGTFAFTYLVTGNAICDCTLSVGGTQSSGNAVMSGCNYRAGTGGGTDPGCSTLNATYTYSKTSTVLTVCTGGSCVSYH